jgi:hypothetical protein
VHDGAKAPGESRFNLAQIRSDLDYLKTGLISIPLIYTIWVMRNFELAVSLGARRDDV